MDSLVVLYFPYPSYGGVSVLFSQLLQPLKTHFSRVALCDSHGGYLHSLWPLDTISTSELVSLSHTRHITLITQLCPPWKLPIFQSLHPSTNFFMWALHPDNLYVPKKPALPFFSELMWSQRRHKLRTYLHHLTACNSIAAMDYSCSSPLSQAATYLDRPIPILPVSCSQNQIDNCQIARSASISPPVLRRLLWIGRVESFKTQTILYLLDNYLLHQEFLSCAGIKGVDIVGDGDDLLRLTSQYEHDNSIVFHGSLTHSQIDEFVQPHHILFAHGMSIYNGLSHLIPTLILDYSHSPIPVDFPLVRLIESTDSLDDLGHNIELPSIRTSYTFLDGLNSTLCFVNKELYSSLLQSVSPSCIALQLTTHIQRSTLTKSILERDRLGSPDFATLAYSYSAKIIQSSRDLHGWQYF